MNTPPKNLDWENESFVSAVRQAYTGELDFDEALHAYSGGAAGTSSDAAAEDLHYLQRRVYSGTLSAEQNLVESDELARRHGLTRRGGASIADAIAVVGRAQSENTDAEASQQGDEGRRMRSWPRTVVAAGIGIALGVSGTLASTTVIGPQTTTSPPEVSASPQDAAKVTPIAELADPQDGIDLDAPNFGVSIRSETVRALNIISGSEESEVALYGAYGTDKRVCLIASLTDDDFAMACIDEPSFPDSGLVVKWNSSPHGEPAAGSATWKARTRELEWTTVSD